jgi:hypothetical protein
MDNGVDDVVGLPHPGCPVITATFSVSLILSPSDVVEGRDSPVRPDRRRSERCGQTVTACAKRLLAGCQERRQASRLTAAVVTVVPRSWIDIDRTGRVPARPVCSLVVGRASYHTRL